MADKKKRTMRFKKIDDAIAVTVAHLESGGLIVNEPVLDTSMETWTAFYKTWDSRVKKPGYVKEYKAGEEAQLQEERAFLEKYNSCGQEKYFSTEEIQSRLGSIDMARFGKMLTGEFYDDATMNSMVCMAGSAYLTSDSALAPNERIRAWVRNLRRIGAESISGYALLGDAGYGLGEEGTAKSPFIVKALRNTDKSNELMHEVFIGLAATNHLRMHVPNYAYIYGFFECSPPLAGPLTDKDSSGKTIATFCNTRGEGNDTIQAVYENIAPAKSFREALADWDGRMFMQYYIGILMALHKAYELYKFTHYDLHDENVLMRKCLDSRYLEVSKGKKKSFYIPYNLKLSDGRVQRYYVSSDGDIPVLIDYGRNHVEIEGKHYGMPNSIGFNRDGTFRDKPNPMYDAYKLLGFSLATCLNDNNIRLLTQIAPLFRYFNVHEAVVDILVELRNETYYELPYLTGAPDLEAFIDYTIKYAELMGYEDVVTTKPPLGSFILLPVSERLEVSVLERLGANKMQLALPRPRTILEAYDVLSKQVRTYSYHVNEEQASQAKQVKASHQREKIIALRSYRTIRDSFARPRDNGLSDLERALEYERQRLARIVYHFFLGLAGETKAEAMEADFLKNKNILTSINKKAFVMTLSGSIELYFNESTLVTVKNYIGKIALFTELRQSLMTSLRGLNYMITAYTIVADNNSAYPALLTKIGQLYSYIYGLVEGLETIYQEYAGTIEAFVSLFRGKRDEYMRRKDIDDEYAWYFNTATTLPSLLLEWPPLKAALTLPE